MNFYESQDRARRHTALLVFLYGITVAAIAMAVYYVALGAWYSFDLYQASEAGRPIPSFSLWRAYVFRIAVCGVFALVLFGTLGKIIELNAGGRAVAEMLGGRPISPATDDPDEKRVLNVVEEMAIASGMAVPPVYLLEEQGINAFAAGFSTRDAVIGVTRGSVRLLTRDELQGVIAHEFSHIFNGDMRLNIRLMGILHGILLISMVGRILMRSTGRRSKGGGALVAAGLGLYLVGWIGVFCASIIKSAVSRQRESLADASGVQFTRYPAGLAGALKKIGGLAAGSVIAHPRAEEASHLFFSEGVVRDFFSSMFATHPPLKERIFAIDPQFDGSFPEVKLPTEKARPEPLSNKPRKAVLADIPVMGALAAAAVVSRAGLIDETRLAYAASLLDEIPPLLKESVREPFAASAVVYALLLDKNDDTVKAAQKKELFSKGNYSVYLKLQRLLGEVEKADAKLRLPLVDLAMPALAGLSPRQYGEFRSTAQKLILADGRVQPFELALKLVLFHHLDKQFGVGGEAKATGHSPEASLAELAALVAKVGAGAQGGMTEAEAAKIEDAIGALKKTTYAFKQKAIKALAKTVLEDRQVTAEELEMLRAFADTLDCPLPPLTA